jgi:kynurenine formamidase
MLHHMKSTGTESPDKGHHVGFDWFGMDIHGRAFTHVDAHSHVFWDGRMYNDRPARVVESLRGDTTGGIDHLRDGVLTRGVLLDFPRWKGIDGLDPSYMITPADVSECSLAQNVSLESGDALVLRVGRETQARDTAAGRSRDRRGFPGLAVECLGLLHEREVALVCCDGMTDPAGRQGGAASIHTIGLVSMGLWLVDNADLDRLATLCVERELWEFALMLAPLRLENATGSPVNPIAIL